MRPFLLGAMFLVGGGGGCLLLGVRNSEHGELTLALGAWPPLYQLRQPPARDPASHLAGVEGISKPQR